MSEIKFNDKKIRKLLKQFSEELPTINVGILKDNNSRTDGRTNAEIGSIHEFGSLDGKIPMRSFLRMPLYEWLGKEIKNIQKQKDLNIEEVAEQIGIAAVAVITDAFATNGFGTWEKCKTKDEDILVDTGQLRDSISYEVEK